MAALEAALQNTIFSGRLYYSAVTGSTNSDAMAAARAGAPHGSVYLADEQLAGRGRGDHRWESAAGQGLYVSVLLRPGVSSRTLHLFPLAAGLAAAEAVFRVSRLTVDLRWPNDLLISTPQTKTSPREPRSDGRKTGGILVESKTDRDEVAFVVIGIGINVHQQRFVSDVATPATSLDLALGRTISRQELLIALLESLERETCCLHDPAVTAVLPARVEQVSTWLWDRQVEVHGPQACTGVTAGLDENGFLRVKTDKGFVTVQTGGIRAAKTD